LHKNHHKEGMMKLTRSLMGRRQFLFSAGAASASALAAGKLAGLAKPLAETDTAAAAVKETGQAKCVVVYSSMTGNTEKAGRAIAKGLEEAAGSCDIISMRDASPYEMGDYDLIAFGWPLMGPNLKQDVQWFFDDLRYVGGKHVILFSTSDSGSNNHGKAVEPLTGLDAIILGSRSWHGAVYGPLGDPTPGRGDGHPDKADLEDARTWAIKMWELSQGIYAGKTETPKLNLQSGNRGEGGGMPGGMPEGGMPVGGARGEMPEGGMPEGGARGEMPEGGMPGGGAGGGGRGSIHPDLVGLENDTFEELKIRIHFNIRYEQDKCMFPTCSRCMDICPVHGIDFTQEPRIYSDPCMMCAMCDQVCPTGAIYVDPEHMEWQREVEAYGDDVVQVYQAYPYHPKFVVGYGRPYGYDPYTLEDRGDGSNMKIKKD
jgi:flavodoxin/ferredoxin